MKRLSMERFPKTLSRHLIPATLIVLLVFAGPLHRCRAESRERLPEAIQVRLVPSEESICIGSERLPLEIYLTNNSSQEITLSSEWIFRGTTFDVVYDQESDDTRIATLGTRGDPFPGVSMNHSWFSLSPGASKRYVTSVELRDRDFFTGPAFYRLAVQCTFFTRGSSGGVREVELESNNVLFELKRCRQK